MRAIDTNVLVRLIIRDDPAQLAKAEAFIEGGAWVPTLALAETAWVLSSVYELSSGELAKAIKMLLDHRDLVLENQDAVAETLGPFTAHPSLGFTDCLILALARKSGHAPLGTFDRNMAKLPGAQRL